jgi:hypothetical protein
MRENYSLVKLVEHVMTECLRRDKMKICKKCVVELNSGNTSVESAANEVCQTCYIEDTYSQWSNEGPYILDLSKIEVTNLNVIKPDEDYIHWDPKEYKPVYIDLEKGQIKFTKIK